MGQWVKEISHITKVIQAPGLVLQHLYESSRFAMLAYPLFDIFPVEKTQTNKMITKYCFKESTLS